MKWRKVQNRFLEQGAKLAMGEGLFHLVFNTQTKVGKVVLWRHAMICAYYLNGLVQREIAEKLNMNTSSIHNALKNYKYECKGFGSDITDRLKQIHWYTFQRVPMVCNECELKFQRL